MRKITFFLLLLVGVSTSPLFASGKPASAAPSEAVIFVEGGVEFAVYPDGQFDFFYNPGRNGYNINIASPNINISFNAGYDYGPYVQYDDFGAVVQIERVPIYYDYFGRIVQAGGVSLSYNSFGLLSRVGHLHFHYNAIGQLIRTSGFINPLNPRYAFKPWHRYYMRPLPAVAVVYSQPYRTYYQPHRMSYNKYRKHYKKQKFHQKDFYRPGIQVSAYSRGSRSSEPVYRDAPSSLRSNKNTSRSTAAPKLRSNQNTGIRPATAARAERSYGSGEAAASVSRKRSAPETRSGALSSTRSRSEAPNAEATRSRAEKASAASRSYSSREAAAPAKAVKARPERRSGAVKSTGSRKAASSVQTRSSRDQQSVSGRSQSSSQNRTGTASRSSRGRN